MISNNMYKVLEYCLLPYLQRIGISPYQYGYIISNVEFTMGKHFRYAIN